MKPIDFPQADIVIGRDQPAYLPLPACIRDSDGSRVVTSCWKMDWRDRLWALFTGRVYISQMTFGGKLQPLRVTMEFEE